VPLTAEARTRGRQEAARKRRLAQAVRVLTAEQLQALHLEDADDIEALIRAKKRWFAHGASGEVDPATWREGTRLLVSLGGDFKVRDLQQRVRQLERVLRTYEQQARATTRGLPARSA